MSIILLELRGWQLVKTDGPYYIYIKHIGCNEAAYYMASKYPRHLACLTCKEEAPNELVALKHLANEEFI